MAAPGAFMSRAIPPAAAWLGAAGVVPFVLAALAVMLLDSAHLRQLTLVGFVAYSAATLAFLGGIRWGAALGEPTLRSMILAVMPLLWAVGCLLILPQDAIRVLALLYAVMGIFDVMRRPAPEWPAWFMQLRARLSGVVVVIHVALIAALAGQA
jgi:hypothetical protein